MVSGRCKAVGSSIQLCAFLDFTLRTFARCYAAELNDTCAIAACGQSYSCLTAARFRPDLLCSLQVPRGVHVPEGTHRVPCLCWV
jgi:hypothetical protein